MVGLLFLFLLINFADRAALGPAAIPMMQKLATGHTQFGLIGSSFFVFFSVGAVIGGFLMNRVGIKWVRQLGAVWPLCQLPMLLPVSMAALIANRLVLGFSDGPACPVRHMPSTNGSRASAARCSRASLPPVP